MAEQLESRSIHHHPRIPRKGVHFMEIVLRMWPTSRTIAPDNLANSIITMVEGTRRGGYYN